MRAVFLDRDGVINRIVYHHEIGVIDTPFTVEQFELLPGVGEAISSLNAMGFKVVVVSNQPGVAKGHFSPETLEAMHEKMRGLLAAQGARIDAVYWCPHHPEEGGPPYRMRCDCRKPEPGLLLQAAREMGVDLGQSYMVGDSITDVQAGERAGCRTLLVGRAKCDLCRLLDGMNVVPGRIVPSLLEAARFIGEKEGLGCRSS